MNTYDRNRWDVIIRDWRESLERNLERGRNHWNVSGVSGMIVRLIGLIEILQQSMTKASVLTTFFPG